MQAAERERLIREGLQSIGEDTFPDDQVEWGILSIRHVGEYSLAISAPSPPSVGYPQFAFVLHFGVSGPMRDCACYCFDRGTWKLLCTSPGTPTEWKTLGVSP